MNDKAIIKSPNNLLPTQHNRIVEVEQIKQPTVTPAQYNFIVVVLEKFKTKQDNQLLFLTAVTMFLFGFSCIFGLVLFYGLLEALL